MRPESAGGGFEFGRTLLGSLAALASLPYGLAVRLRNRAYDAGLLRARCAAAVVVSVGNLSVGGTGKTPLVAMLARAARAAGRTPAILLRGYRRGARRAAESDEAALHARLAQGVLVVADPDRVRGAERALAAGADLLILDDGFQHRRLKRDLDLVLADARDPFAGGRLLPRGLLREPLSSLARAHAL
ncbi:MAG: tetraacyldisaccharide 4'-kinase, partial [Planctomycetes bacterium]|nr:tetraacyldisaccharide 4'-kinase [Planctomycetota bacterium]